MLSLQFIIDWGSNFAKFEVVSPLDRVTDSNVIIYLNNFYLIWLNNLRIILPYHYFMVAERTNHVASNKLLTHVIPTCIAIICSYAVHALQSNLTIQYLMKFEPP